MRKFFSKRTKTKVVSEINRKKRKLRVLQRRDPLRAGINKGHSYRKVEYKGISFYGIWHAYPTYRKNLKKKTGEAYSDLSELGKGIFLHERNIQDFLPSGIRKKGRDIEMANRDEAKRIDSVLEKIEFPIARLISLYKSRPALMFPLVSSVPRKATITLACIFKGKISLLENSSRTSKSSLTNILNSSALFSG